MKSFAINAFNDNYIWVLQSGNHCMIVDPGESTPVLDFFAEHPHLIPCCVLITHLHADHINGIKDLHHHFPELMVYGPRNINKYLDSAHEIPLDVETINLPIMGNAMVLHTPGHTAEHLSFVVDQYCFTGDTLFYGGCGRPFHDIYALYQSMQVLLGLPDELMVCCGHDYTHTNLQFALLLEPNNQTIIDRINHLPVTEPASLALEKMTNPFLRTHLTSFQQSVMKTYQHWLQDAPKNFHNIKLVMDTLKNTLQNHPKDPYDTKISGFLLFQCIRHLKDHFYQTV